MFSSFQAAWMKLTNTMIPLLTDAYGDVCRPLIVILAGDGFLSDQLEAKLALEPQDASVWEAVPLSYSIERRPRVATTLFVYFCKDTFLRRGYLISGCNSSKPSTFHHVPKNIKELRNPRISCCHNYQSSDLINPQQKIVPNQCSINPCLLKRTQMFQA